METLRGVSACYLALGMIVYPAPSSSSQRYILRCGDQYHGLINIAL